MTPAQIILIKIAVKQLDMPDRQYRILLKNVADVNSSTKLTNPQFEDLMAILEERGFRHQGKPEDYWRNKVKLRGSFADSRQLHLIQQLADQTQYNLTGLANKFSNGRTWEPSKLKPHEAHNLIEMLKSAVARASTPAHRTDDLFTTPAAAAAGVPHGGDEDEFEEPPF